MLEELFWKILENSTTRDCLEIISSFSEHIFQETAPQAASEIMWVNHCDGFLFHKCSRPEILE